MDNAVFHVLLGGRKVGPYDRRTIVGMSIKKTLTGDHVLIGADGSRTTVAALIGKADDREESSTGRGGSAAVAATFPASVAQVEGRGFEIPRFKGDVEVRVQPDVLRIAGRFRQGLRWKDGRIKIPVKDVVHTRVDQSRVELWLQPSDPDGPKQRLVLELSTDGTAADFVALLPGATPYPEPAGRRAKGTAAVSHKVLWVALASVVVVVGLVLMVLFYRRLH